MSAQKASVHADSTFLDQSLIDASVDPPSIEPHLKKVSSISPTLTETPSINSSIHLNPTLELPKKIMYNLIKRTIDITGSVILICLLSPLFIFISLLIKVDDSKGNIFFYQDRVGKDETVFKMIKFRSMYSDAEKRLEELIQFNEMEGAMFKMKDDPRITKVGKYLRILSLDELPQLINVLKGDMSLVGPRPPLTREVLEYTQYDKQRLRVKPGITGLWQVSGRNALSFNQMVELDLKYIQTCSIKNDIKILFKTIKVVLKSENAY